MQHRIVTDGQTHDDSIYRARIASRSKKLSARWWHVFRMSAQRRRRLCVWRTAPIDVHYMTRTHAHTHTHATPIILWRLSLTRSEGERRDESRSSITAAAAQSSGWKYRMCRLSSKTRSSARYAKDALLYILSLHRSRH